MRDGLRLIRGGLLVAALVSASCNPADDGGTKPTGGASWLNFVPTSFNVATTPGFSTPFTLNVHSYRTFTQPVNVALIDLGGVTDGNVVLHAYSASDYAADFWTRTSLETGTHTGSIRVRLCYDNPLVCAQEVDGSPWTIPYSVLVIDESLYSFARWETVRATTPFLDDYALTAMGSTLVAASAGFYSGVMETWTSVDEGANWTRSAAAGPTPFTRNFALAADGAAVFLSGGELLGPSSAPLGTYSSAVWKFDGTSWTQMTAAAPWSARAQHSMVRLGSDLYVFGGRTAADLTDAWRSSDDGATWSLLSDPLPAGGGGATCAVARSGGILLAKSGVWTSSDGTAWQAQAGYAAPYALGALECGVLGDRTYIYGPGLGILGDGVVSSADLVTWQFEPGPTFHGVVPSLTAVNGRLFILAGAGTSARPVVRTVPW